MSNPNPDMSGLTPFAPGQSGNPVGKTSAQRKLEVENAERATRIRNKMLLALESDLDGSFATGIPAMASVTGDMLRLIKDAEDRGLGAPKQTIAGDPENPLAQPFFDPSKMSTTALAELLGAVNIAPPATEPE